MRMESNRDEILRREKDPTKEPHEAETTPGYGDKKLEGPNRPAE